MIVETKVRDVETSAELKTTNFTIKASGKAFKLLSSGLYKDKIKAIVREISCNAYDAHTAAGVNEPFYVHLPTDLKPTFIVRDYGAGLTDYEMETLFTTYFESTKTTSNDQIGAFGLGSKSPFSYTEQFNATTVYADATSSTGYRKTAFHVFMNDFDEPNIAPVHTEETTERTGLEISLAVKRQDFHAFQRAAEDVYLYFDKRPTVSPPLTYKSREVWVQGDDYTFYKGDGQAYARMGVVAYPIDSSIIPAKAAGWPVVVDFKIGEVDITAGREELSYDPVTKAAVLNALKRIEDDFFAQASLMIKECKTLREAHEFFGTYKKYKTDPLLFRGKSISDNFVEIVPEQLRLYPKHVRRDKSAREVTAKFSLYPNDVIILNDLVKGSVSRIRLYKQTQLSYHGTRVNAYMFDKFTPEFLEMIDGWEIIKTSDMPKPAPVYRERTTPKKPVSYTRLWDNSVVEETLEAPLGPDDIYVLITSKNYKTGKDKFITKSKTIDWARLCAFVDIKKIYFLPATTGKRYLKEAKFLEEILAKKRDCPTIQYKLAEYESLNSTLIGHLRFLIEEIGENHEISKIAKIKIESHNQVDYNIKSTFGFYRHYTTTTETESTKQWRAIVKKYPILGENVNSNIMRHYVKMTDQLEQVNQ